MRRLSLDAAAPYPMKYSKICLVLLTLVLTVSVKAELTPEKRKEIDQMMRLTGMEKLVDQMIGQMVSSFKTTMTGAPDGFWDRFQSKVNGRDMIEKVMPIYDKYYTLEDLRAVNAFYASPAGQKILATLPQVMQESMAVGQTWGQEMAQKAADELAAEKKATAK
jgi:hypothetical protein